jgi:lipopolysaccharide/colanic/teichoic acid biosynthesis glycosyltransferase
LDLFLILLGLPILLPSAILTALAIKLVSPGPVLFVQNRVGRGGRVFRCLKFRTMEVNAPQALHCVHLHRLVATGAPLRKLDGKDRRLIPLGRWLRTSGLDELPQIWNVLRGEMSWVGPRPCAEYEMDLFSGSELERFRVLPGLTGLWQVSGKNDTTFAEMVRLDGQYVRDGSVLADLGILVRTPAVVLSLIARLVRETFLGTAAEGEELPVMSAPARQVASGVETVVEKDLP